MTIIIYYERTEKTLKVNKESDLYQLALKDEYKLSEVLERSYNIKYGIDEIKILL